MALFKRRAKAEDRDVIEAREAEAVKATIATAAVKAQALALVGDLRLTLDRLDKVLNEGVPDVDRVLLDVAKVRETESDDRPDVSA